MPRVDDPFEILQRVKDNAYKVDLLRNYGVSVTLNVKNSSPHLEDDYLFTLRENSSQQGEDDGHPQAIKFWALKTSNKVEVC